MRSITASDIVLHHFTLLVEEPVDVIWYKVDGQVQSVVQVDCFVIFIEDVGVVDSEAIISNVRQARPVVILKSLKIGPFYLNKIELFIRIALRRIKQLKDPLLFLSRLGSENQLCANHGVILVKCWVDSRTVIIEGLCGDERCCSDHVGAYINNLFMLSHIVDLKLKDLVDVMGNTVVYDVIVLPINDFSVRFFECYHVWADGQSKYLGRRVAGGLDRRKPELQLCRVDDLELFGLQIKKREPDIFEGGFFSESALSLNEEHRSNAPVDIC